MMLSLLMVALLVVVGCSEQLSTQEGFSEEEVAILNEDESSLAGQAVSLGCRTAGVGVYSCEAITGGVRLTRIRNPSSTFSLMNGCKSTGLNTLYMYSCPTSGGYEFCTTRCEGGCNQEQLACNEDLTCTDGTYKLSADKTSVQVCQSGAWVDAVCTVPEPCMEVPATACSTGISCPGNVEVPALGCSVGQSCDTTGACVSPPSCAEGQYFANGICNNYCLNTSSGYPFSGERCTGAYDTRGFCTEFQPAGCCVETGATFQYSCEGTLLVNLSTSSPNCGSRRIVQECPTGKTCQEGACVSLDPCSNGARRTFCDGDMGVNQTCVSEVWTETVRFADESRSVCDGTNRVTKTCQASAWTEQTRFDCASQSSYYTEDPKTCLSGSSGDYGYCADTCVENEILTTCSAYGTSKTVYKCVSSSLAYQRSYTGACPSGTTCQTISTGANICK